MENLENGVSQEETQEVEVAESMSMDERLGLLTEELIDLPEEDEPQPEDEPAPEEEKPEVEEVKVSEPEAEQPEPIEPPSFLNEHERTEFAALPRSQQEAISRVGSGAQKQITQTQQELAAERNRLASLEGLWRQMQMDPNYAQHVLKGYRPVQPGQPQEAEKPQFDDPIQELKWETQQDAIKAMNPRFEEQRIQMETMQRQIVMEQAKAQFRADPQFNDVQAAIIGHIKSLPESIAQPMYQHLNNDPRAYGEMFDHFKGKIAAQAEAKAEQPKPQPVKTQERAPILEAAGPASEPKEIAQKKEMKRKKADALRNGGIEEVSDYLYKSGLLSHIA